MLVPPPVPAAFALLSNGFNKSGVENVAGADLQPPWWREGSSQVFPKQGGKEGPTEPVELFF